MTRNSTQDFADIISQIIGDLDIVNPDALPNPWLCKNIFRKKDLQWAGYIGDFSQQEHALVFGINLEFTGAWRRIYPKVRDNYNYFSECLRGYLNFEWHWMARPGVIAKNPEIRYRSRMWAYQVDVDAWLGDLDSILERRVMWSPSVPMRPQMQIVRCIGLPTQLSDVSLIRQNIQQTVADLQPLVDFLGR
jgi:hypothetical protein